jgi:hypothetical protein
MIVAPTTTAELGSSTVPLMEPVTMPCAEAGRPSRGKTEAIKIVETRSLVAVIDSSALSENALIRTFTITQILAHGRRMRAISDERARDVTNEPGKMMKR